MFERTRRGFGIAASSFKLLLAHPRLLLLPVLSSITLVGAVLLIGSAMYVGQAAHIPLPLLLPGFFVLLLAMIFTSVFFNAALVACVLEAFAGRRVSLRAGLAASVARLPRIFAWALYAATMGLLIGMLQGMLRKLGFLGALIGNTASMGWAIVTYFVVPVLVTENVGPDEAVKRSGEIIKRNWGNAVGIEVGLGALLVLAVAPPIALIATVNSGNVAPALHSAMLVYAGVAIFVYFALLIAVYSTLDVIFRTGVYLYATTGETPRGIDPAAMQGVFRG